MKGVVFDKWEEQGQMEVADSIWKQEGGDALEGKGLVLVSFGGSPKPSLIEGPEHRQFTWEVSPELHSEDMERRKPRRTLFQQGRASC